MDIVVWIYQNKDVTNGGEKMCCVAIRRYQVKNWQKMVKEWIYESVNIVNLS